MKRWITPMLTTYGKVEEVTAHHKPGHKIPPPFKKPSRGDHPMGAHTLSLSDCR